MLVLSNVGYLLLNYMKNYDVYVWVKPGPIAAWISGSVDVTTGA